MKQPQSKQVLGKNAIEREIRMLKILHKTSGVGITIHHPTQTIDDLKDYNLIEHIGNKVYTLTAKGTELIEEIVENETTQLENSF